ncbi:zinc finger protein 793-like [Perognathus longimembris pacificus]|uniref:zinc finger protein 793-like n=1 Tax=Perognathus longimembris pacificus TaxID=214514 RepID=UPI002019251E|nr:zinc finger protein 793-like [Perognathus longimembris pacificus]
MLKTYSNLVSLGHCVLKPKLIVKLEQVAEPWIGESSDRNFTEDTVSLEGHHHQGQLIPPKALILKTLLSVDRIVQPRNLMAADWDLASTLSSGEPTQSPVLNTDSCLEFFIILQTVEHSS